MLQHLRKNYVNCRHRHAVVLVLTLVILVVVSVLAYTLAARVAAQQHRNQYMIDYQAARYACDSALKYALTTARSINTQLIHRAEEPDFSHLFALTEEEYLQMIKNWPQEEESSTKQTTDANEADTLAPLEPNSLDYLSDIFDANAPTDANALTVRGPYGPTWPLIAEPLEIEIGPAIVSIEIEDENAKMPVSWAITGEQKVRREADAALETFCEWMQMDLNQIDDLRAQLKTVANIKPFKLNLKPITVTEKKQTTPSPRARPTSRRGRRQRPTTATTKKTRPASAHATDFAKLFHSSLIDTETLARPVIESPNRTESALKYLAMWGSQKVNINTAPRHVLEAAFTFGGDATEIAEEIIKIRRKRPFRDIKVLKKSLPKYTDSIRKTEKYIITRSRFFTIRITAFSGVAKSSAVVSVLKDGKKFEKLAILFE